MVCTRQLFLFLFSFVLYWLSICCKSCTRPESIAYAKRRKMLSVFNYMKSFSRRMYMKNLPSCITNSLTFPVFPFPFSFFLAFLTARTIHDDCLWIWKTCSTIAFLFERAITFPVKHISAWGVFGNEKCIYGNCYKVMEERQKEVSLWTRGKSWCTKSFFQCCGCCCRCRVSFDWQCCVASNEFAKLSKDRI